MSQPGWCRVAEANRLKVDHLLDHLENKSHSTSLIHSVWLHLVCVWCGCIGTIQQKNSAVLADWPSDNHQSGSVQTQTSLFISYSTLSSLQRKTRCTQLFFSSSTFKQANRSSFYSARRSAKTPLKSSAFLPLSLQKKSMPTITSLIANGY